MNDGRNIKGDGLYPKQPKKERGLITPKPNPPQQQRKEKKTLLK